MSVYHGKFYTIGVVFHGVTKYHGNVCVLRCKAVVPGEAVFLSEAVFPVEAMYHGEACGIAMPCIIRLYLIPW